MGERRSKKRVLVAVGVAVLLILVVGGYLLFSRPAAPELRTAAVAYGDVSQTLSSTGTIEPVNRADLNFPISGRVSQVFVNAGQQVTVGQPLAQLDNTTLSDQVASAQSAIASAQAKLASDEASQTSAVSAFATTQPQAAMSQPDSSALQAVTNAQKTLTADQQTADAALAKARTAIVSETSACEQFLSAVGNNATAAAATTASSTPSATATPTTTTTPLPPSAGACTTQLNAVLAEQNAVSQAQSTVANDENALTKALSQLSQQTLSSSSAGQATSGVTKTGGSATRAPVSAQQLTADQAVIDSTTAQLAVAQQSLAQAQLVSPITGTVGIVSLSPGQAVSGAAVSSPQVEILGAGTDEVTTTVDDAQVALIKVGAQVQVTPDGQTTPVAGKVVSIGLLSTSTSGSAAYPITIGLTGNPQSLPAGSGASTSIVLSTVSHVLTVPSSAVSTTRAGSTVQVVRDGRSNPVRVEVGTVGAVFTEVKSGLQPGDQIVLADVNAPMPTANNSNLRSLVGGGGGGGRGTGG